MAHLCDGLSCAKPSPGLDNVPKPWSRLRVLGSPVPKPQPKSEPCLVLGLPEPVPYCRAMQLDMAVAGEAGMSVANTEVLHTQMAELEFELDR